jgi:hypothetical protein
MFTQLWEVLAPPTASRGSSHGRHGHAPAVSAVFQTAVDIDLEYDPEIHYIFSVATHIYTEI